MRVQVQWMWHGLTLESGAAKTNTFCLPCKHEGIASYSLQPEALIQKQRKEDRSLGNKKGVKLS